MNESTPRVKELEESGSATRKDTVPKGWMRSTVGEACSIKNHLRLPLSTDQRASIRGPYPYFGPTGALSYIDHYRIDEPIALIGEDGDHFLKFKDRSMTLRFNGKANVNNHAHVIGDSNECLSSWFYYWFMHRDLKAVLSRQGVGRYKLTKAGLEELEILLPPIEEQGAIIRLLDTWNEAITCAEQLVANSTASKQALMQQLLSDGGNQRRNKVVPRAHASELFSSSSTRRNGGLQLLSVMQDVGVVPRASLGRKVVMPEGSTEGYKLVEPGDFVISLRSFEGGLEYSRHKGLVSPAYTVLKPKQAIADDFFRHYFKSRDFIGRLAVAVIGIRDGKQISYDDFSFLRIPNPSLDDQQRIAEILNAAEALIEKHKQALDKLRAEKVALMQQLLRGKRRVRMSQSAEADPA